MFRSSVGDALNDAREKSSYYGRAASGDGGGVSGMANPLGMGGGGELGQSATRNTTLSQHAEQYRHYNGWVYGSIAPVAKRVARQPVRLAVVPSAQPQGDVQSAPPVPSVPGGRKAKITGSGSTSYKRKPWEKPSDPYEIAKQCWFKKTLPGQLKAYFETAELVEQHPLLDAINDPNPIMVRWTLMFVTVASLMLTAKAYWWVRARAQDEQEANPGAPIIEIWPVPSSWITPVHTPQKLYDHWEIRADGAIKAEKVPAEQIIYFYLPDPASPLGAHSPLQAQARAVVADEAIAEAQRRGFANGTFPGMAIVVGRSPDVNGQPGERPMLNKEQRMQLITAFKQAYKGVYNTDEPIILDQMIQDIKRISMTNREMDYMESGKYTKDRITQGFGVNPISMGQVEGANRASSATADDHLCQNTVNPIIELISEVITAWMNPLFAKKGQKLLMYLEEAYAVDPDSERADWALLAQYGAAQRDELRAALKGLPPIIDGNQCLVPGGMQVIDCSRVNDGTEIDNHTRAAKNSEPDTADLPVPMIFQSYPYDCGAASARGVAEYVGLQPGTEDDFIAALRSKPEVGTTPQDIFNYFAHHGCEPKKRDRLGIENLRKEIRQSRPILCPMQYAGDGPEYVGGTEPSGHWVTVVNITKDSVRFLDPIDGPTEMSFRDWMTNWHDEGDDGRPYVRFGISVGAKPQPFAIPTVSNPNRGFGKVVDNSGHEHADDGTFGSGAGIHHGGGDNQHEGRNPQKPTTGNEHVETAQAIAKANPEEAKKPGFVERVAAVAKGVHDKVNNFLLDHATAVHRIGAAASAISNLITTPSDLLKHPDMMGKFGSMGSVSVDQVSGATGGLVPGHIVAQVAATAICKGIEKVKAMLGKDGAPYTADELAAAAELLAGVFQSAGVDLSQDEAEKLLQDSADQKGLTPYECKAHTMPEADRLAMWDKAHDQASGSLSDALLTYFRAERARILEALPEALQHNKTWSQAKAAPFSEENDASDVETLLDHDEHLEPLLDQLLPLQSSTRRLRAAVREPLAKIAEEGATQENDALAPAQKSELIAWRKAGRPTVDRKPLPKEVRKRVNDYLDDMVSDPYWVDINKTTRLKMSRAIRRGIANSEPVDQIEARVRGALSDLADQMRAQTIAKTEATAALNIGFQAAREHYGPKFVKGKRWTASAIHAASVRPTHKAADGQTRKNGSKFRVGGVYCEFPGDPVLPPGERCNCRCVALTIPAD